MDIPFGDYDSECGPVTVLAHVKHGTVTDIEANNHDMYHDYYFMVELHDPPFEFDQKPNEFASIYIRPKGLVLKDPKNEEPCVYIQPNVNLAREMCRQWRLCNDKELLEIADKLEEWIKKQP
jgi:hypothetical protein